MGSRDKNKDKKTIADAFEDIFKNGRICQNIWTDSGGEYDNHYWRRMLRLYGIEAYKTQIELTAIVAERFNQSLLNRMAKMFTERGNKRYIDDIQNIVDDYYNSYHSSIKMTPNETSKPQNEGIVYYNLYNKRRREMMTRNNKPKFKIGDIVRIYKLRKF